MVLHEFSQQFVGTALEIKPAARNFGVKQHLTGLLQAAPVRRRPGQNKLDFRHMDTVFGKAYFLGKIILIRWLSIQHGQPVFIQPDTFSVLCPNAGARSVAVSAMVRRDLRHSAASSVFSCRSSSRIFWLQVIAKPPRVWFFSFSGSSGARQAIALSNCPSVS